MGDRFINDAQLLGILLFFAGSWLLERCRRWESKRQEKMKDPRDRWAFYGKGKFEFLLPTTTRGTFMAIAGAGLALWGLILFMVNI